MIAVNRRFPIWILLNNPLTAKTEHLLKIYNKMFGIDDIIQS